MRKIVLCTMVIVLILVAFSGRFLVLNKPEKAEVIVVLAGETRYRPARGLELLNQGYAPRLVLDVPAGAMVYQWSQTELAKKYVEGLPQARAITICPIHGLSTKDESSEADKCIDSIGGGRVLLVTSDYHTRRSFSVFRREVPSHQYSVAASYNPAEFGVWWWQRRQWAKTELDEWLRLIWWQVIDRWW